jgi:hypothetical protein
MSDRYGADWVASYGPPSFDYPNIMDPAFALRTIIARGTDFLDLGNERRRAAARLVGARNRVFHFASISKEETRAIIADVVALLEFLRSRWTTKVQLLGPDPSGPAFDVILKSVRSQATRADVNAMMATRRTPESFVADKERVEARSQEWRRFQAASRQLGIPTLPNTQTDYRGPMSSRLKPRPE